MATIDEAVVYDAATYFPRQKTIFRLANRFPFLLLLPFFKKLVYRRLPNVTGSIVTPGFNCIMGEHIHARDVYLNDTEILDYAPVRIGEGTCFSGRNAIITSTHSFSNFSEVTAQAVHIGRNVWVTNRCIILGGVTIGDNSVIGAGSVVTRDIPPNVFAAGNPCRVIRPIVRS